MLSLLAWLSTGSRVKFLVNAMEKMGCSLEPGFFSSVDCEGKINGGFHLDDEGKPGVSRYRFLQLRSDDLSV